MINVNGHRFMTLADPIYINGRRVREIYANGKLVYPSMPAGIKIITPPNKWVYDVGEEIDYTGIVAQIINTDGSPYKSLDYPDGIIPFEELIFPISEASGDGYWYQEAIIHTEGGINALTLGCNTYARKDSRDAYYTSAFYKWIDQYNTPAYFSTYSPSVVLATVYDGWVYVYGVTDSSYGTSTMWVWEFSMWWDYWGRTYYGKWNKSFRYEDRMSYLPVSDVDPISEGTVIDVQFLNVPVKWKNRYGDNYFEDFTEIRIKRETPLLP